MSARPKRKYVNICAYCKRPFNPWRRDQQYCDRVCMGHGKVLRQKELVKKWLDAGRAAQKTRRIAIVRKRLEGVTSVAEAYRLGRTDGYGVGWKARIDYERRGGRRKIA